MKCPVAGHECVDGRANRMKGTLSADFHAILLESAGREIKKMEARLYKTNEDAVLLEARVARLETIVDMIEDHLLEAEGSTPLELED